MKRLNRNELLEMLDNMKEAMTSDLLLENVALALSTDDLQDVLKYIDRMFELEIYKDF